MDQAAIDQFMEAYLADAVRKTVYNLDSYALSSIALAKHYPLKLLPLKAQGLASSFDTLPLELHQAIVGHLDLASVFDFKCAFTSTKEAVDALPEVKRILNYARNVVSFAIELGCTHRSTVSELHKKLQQTTCDTCGGLAAFIDVRNLSRKCLQFGGECKPCHIAQTAQQIRRNYRFTDAQFAELDIDKNRFQSVVGGYSGISTKFQESRVTLYDGEAAAKLASHWVSASDFPDDEQLQYKLTAVRAAHLQVGEALPPRRVVLCNICKNASIKLVHHLEALRAYWVGETEVSNEDKYQPSQVALVFAEAFGEHVRNAHARI
ncbi:hypothetical protein N0V86_009168 [Didymella sp. IMI 355093]|nr:hypothetical protein N0V86_009168 [Didymella sp. IMI 355093]